MLENQNPGPWKGKSREMCGARSWPAAAPDQPLYLTLQSRAGILRLLGGSEVEARGSIRCFHREALAGGAEPAKGRVWRAAWVGGCMRAHHASQGPRGGGGFEALGSRVGLGVSGLGLRLRDGLGGYMGGPDGLLLSGTCAMGRHGGGAPTQGPNSLGGSLTHHAS